MVENHQTGRYALKEPYPPVKVSNRNVFYAQLLLDDYASNTSELNAINQYLYHHFRFKNKNLNDIAELEKGISIVEMNHLEILAELILKLGGDPRYRGFRNNNNQYYNAGYVYYGSSILEMLAADIDAEKGAIIQYRQHIEQINDPYIKAILQRIIKDEEYHFSLFSEAYQRYQTATQV